MLKNEEDFNLKDDVDDAKAFMKAAILEAIYTSNDNALNVSFNAIAQYAPIKRNFEEIQSKTYTTASSNVVTQHAPIEKDYEEISSKGHTNLPNDYLHNNYLQLCDENLKHLDYSSPNPPSIIKFNDMFPHNQSHAQKLESCPKSLHDQSFTIEISIGKFVLSGPLIKNLANVKCSKDVNSSKKKIQPTCTCSLTVSFPSLIPPYSIKQQMCISPIAFGTREAIFEHHSQLSWKLLPNHNLQDWCSQDLCVTIMLMWQHFDDLECVGYISLEKVVFSMPDVYKTNLALTLTSQSMHKKNKFNNSFKQQYGLKTNEKKC